MENFKCEKCGKEFDLEIPLKQHINDRHEMTKTETAKPVEKTEKIESKPKPIKIKPRILLIFGLIIMISAGIYLFYNKSTTESPYTGNVISNLPNSPVHWHPVLNIIIDGKKQRIPANIGIGSQYSSSPLWDPVMSMTGIHTHDDSGTLHWEIMTVPKKENLYFGNFFQIWGEPFNSECIFEYCNGNGKTVKMLVNGQPNYDFDKYIVRDKDRIEIVY